MKRAIVTGGAGFVGTNLIKRLLKDGHNVVSLDNYSTGKAENEQEGCKYYDVDIRDVLDFDFFMEEPDVIYHLAALARIQPSFKKHCPKGRRNFLSYGYVLYKFCELLEMDEYLACFPLLKNRDKLYLQDKTWEKICKDQFWQYVRTV